MQMHGLAVLQLHNEFWPMSKAAAAFIVRLILVPSLMSILGKANWWLPGWLDRILPRVQIEPGEDEIADVDDPAPAGASVSAGG